MMTPLMTLPPRSVERLQGACIAVLCNRETPQSCFASMAKVFASLGIAYSTYVEGPLSQSLFMTSAVLARHHPEARAIKKQGLLYLHLRNRTVWLLEVTGDAACEEIVHTLPMIATMLSRAPYDEQHFPRIEQALVKTMRTGEGGTIRLCRHMPVAPSETLLDALMNRFLVTLMQCAPFRLQRKRLVAMTRLLKTYCGLHVQPHQIARQFSDQLDRRVIDALAHYSFHDGIDFAQLRSYNYLVADAPQQSMRRVQAINRYPWLRYALTQARVRKWTLSAAPREQEDREIEIAPTAFSPLMSTVTLHPSSNLTSTLTSTPTLTLTCAATSAAISPSQADAATGPIGALRQAIDLALPVAPVIAHVANLSVEVVQWASTWKANRDRSFVLDHPMHFLEMLSWLPPNKRPSTPSGWCVFVERLLVLAEIGGVFFIPADVPFWQIRPTHLLNLMWSNAVGKARLRAWVEEYTGVKPQSSVNRPNAVEIIDRAYRDITSFTTTLANAFDRIGWPDRTDHVTDEGAGSTQRQRWLSKQSLVTLMHMTEHWSKQVSTLKRRHASREIAPLGSWPAILEFPLQLDGFDIVPLDCFMAVDDERKKLGLYRMADAEALYGGNTLLFSVRTDEGKRCALIELRLHTDPLGLDCQHIDGYAYTPVEEFHHVARQLVDALNQSAYLLALQQRLNFQQAIWRDIVDKSGAVALSWIEIGIVKEAIACRVALSGE